MSNSLRLALPALAHFTSASRLAFALFGRNGRLLRSGDATLPELAAIAGKCRVQAILHPGDAIVVNVDVPPLALKRLTAAVHARIEPLTLSDLNDVCIAHGPRAADGQVQAVWCDRRLLLDTWQRLHDAGLKVSAIVPNELAVGDTAPDRPLDLPVDDRWQNRLPNWSLAQPQWRPASRTNKWLPAVGWTAGAALVWLAGLHMYAAQLRGEVDAQQRASEQAVLDAFPTISVVLDPLHQARSQRDRLRLDRGVTGQNDFMPMALAAADILRFAEGHVTYLHYADGKLSIQMAPGYTPPTDESALQLAATSRALRLQKDPVVPHTWHIEPARPTQDREANR